MPRFTIQATPALLTVKSGNQGVFNIVASSTTTTFSGTIAISIENLPFGAYAVFSPSDKIIVTPATSSSIVATITTTPNSTPGLYTIVVSGTYTDEFGEETNTGETVLEVLQPLDLGADVSRSLQFENYNYTHVVFQKENPPLDSEENLAQDIQATISSNYIKSRLASGWLSFGEYDFSSESTSGNTFYTQAVTSSHVSDEQVTLTGEIAFPLASTNIVVNSIVVTDSDGNPFTLNTSSDVTQPNGDYNIVIDRDTGVVSISRVPTTPFGSICVGNIQDGETVLVSYDTYLSDYTLEQAVVNGWLIKVRGTNSTTAVNNIQLSAPSTFGSRQDFVFLEVWRSLIDPTTGANLLDDGTVYPYGNILSKEPSFNSEIIDSEAGVETTKRVQVQYAIRTVSSIDVDTYPDGIDDPKIRSIGPNSNSDNAGNYQYINIGNVTGDYGLWRARCFNTVDGYSWAIPMAVVHRRNTRPYSLTNLNGSSVILLDSVDSNGVHVPSDRPDRLYADQISPQDVTDKRKLVSVQDMFALYQDSLDSLYANGLRSKHGISKSSAGQNETRGNVLEQIDQYAGFNTTPPLPTLYKGKLDNTTKVYSDGFEKYIGFTSVDVPVPSSGINTFTFDVTLENELPSAASGSFFSNDDTEFSLQYESDLSKPQYAIDGLGTNILSVTLLDLDLVDNLPTNVTIYYTVILPPNKKGLTYVPFDIIQITDGTSKNLWYSMIGEAAISFTSPTRTTLGYTDYVEVTPQGVEALTSTPGTDTGCVSYYYYAQGNGALAPYVIPLSITLSDDTVLNFSHPQSVTIGSVTGSISTAVRDENLSQFEVAINAVVPNTTVVKFKMAVLDTAVMLNRSTKGLGPQVTAVEAPIVTSTGTDTFTFTTSGDIAIGAAQLSFSNGGNWVVFVETETAGRFNAIPCTFTRSRIDAFQVKTLNSILDPYAIATGTRVKTYLLKIQPFTNSSRVDVYYRYSPVQTASLPNTVTLDLLSRPSSIDISNLGTGGGDPGYPYPTPLLHIPVNKSSFTTESVLNNETHIKVLGQDVSSGFIRVGFQIPANFRNRITLYTPSSDNLGRAFYANVQINVSPSLRTTTSEDLVVLGPDLSEGIPHKTMYSILAVVTKSSGNSLLPGEVVLLMFTGYHTTTDCIAGVSTGSNSICATIYKLNGNPILRSTEHLLRI